jgi:hypothetical protein
MAADVTQNVIIPIILPNDNVATEGGLAGFGHAAVIAVVNGQATYYEYGLYTKAGDGQVAQPARG